MFECEPHADWFRWHLLVWLSDCLPGVCLRLPFHVCQWVCLCVWVHVEVCLWSANLTLFKPRAISPQPSSTILLIDPHLFQMAPNPHDLSSNFSSLSNPSLSHMLWPTGQASTYLLCLCPTPLLLVLPAEIRTLSRTTPCDIFWFRGYSNLPLHPEVRVLCEMGRILQQIFQHILLWVKPVKLTRKI